MKYNYITITKYNSNYIQSPNIIVIILQSRNIIVIIF